MTDKDGFFSAYDEMALADNDRRLQARLAELNNRTSATFTSLVLEMAVDLLKDRKRGAA